MTDKSSKDAIELWTSVNNMSDEELIVYLEPWGDKYVLEPNKKLYIKGKGPEKEKGFTFWYDTDEEGNSVVEVAAWEGSTAKVYDSDGEEIDKGPDRPLVPTFDD